MVQVLVLATMTTKAEEARFLMEQLTGAHVTAKIIDTSLDTDGRILDGPDKRQAMNVAAQTASKQVTDAIANGVEAVVGIGGGTGGEIILQVMRGMPITFSKVLCTTLPFDPRYAMADNSIVLVPTLADISGLNGILREALENTALIVAGLCKKKRKGELTDIAPSVGITALGATDDAVRPLVAAFAKQNREATVFHSNGFGGAAFARFAQRGAFDAIVDLTPHELTRIHVAGVHVDMPDRFSAGADLPRVILPGALNFIGLGPKDLVPTRFLERPHYQHSGLFTHVKLSEDEMALVARRLAESLNALSGPCACLVPMGGFSHHDRKGGAIEDETLRQICLDTLRVHLRADIPLTPLDAHIFAPDVTDAIVNTLAKTTR